MDYKRFFDKHVYFRYISTSTESSSDLAIKKPFEDAATVLTYEVPEPKVQHVMGNNFGHGESVSLTKIILLY